MPSDSVSCTLASNNALAWLLKAGTTPEEADYHGIKYHTETDRLLIPIRNRSQVTTGILARAVNGEKPKYKIIYGDWGLHYPSEPNTSVVVAVEDVLSSISLMRAGFNAVAILGTSIKPEQASAIAADYSTVVGFFDPDKAGNAAYSKLRRALSIHPVSVYKARANKDPKYFNREELRSIVHEALRR